MPLEEIAARAILIFGQSGMHLQNRYSTQIVFFSPGRPKMNKFQLKKMSQ